MFTFVCNTLRLYSHRIKRSSPLTIRTFTIGTRERDRGKGKEEGKKRKERVDRKREMIMIIIGRFNDPPYVKLKKLDLLTQVCNETNAKHVIQELGLAP